MSVTHEWCQRICTSGMAFSGFGGRTRLTDAHRDARACRQFLESDRWTVNEFHGSGLGYIETVRLVACRPVGGVL